MAQVQLHRHTAPLKLDGAMTHMDLGGIITQLEGDKWIRNHNVFQLQLLGEFAVKEKNRKANWHLEFINVYEGWYQRLSRGRGRIHLLHLVAKHEDVLTNYEAYVWEKVDRPLDWKRMDLPLELRSLSPMVLDEDPSA